MVLPESSMHSMVMTVMKDSLEIAAPVKDTNFPQEPPGRKDMGLSSTKRKMKPKTKFPTTGPPGTPAPKPSMLS